MDLFQKMDLSEKAERIAKIQHCRSKIADPTLQEKHEDGMEDREEPQRPPRQKDDACPAPGEEAFHGQDA